MLLLNSWIKFRVTKVTFELLFFSCWLNLIFSQRNEEYGNWNELANFIHTSFHCPRRICKCDEPSPRSGVAAIRSIFAATDCTARWLQLSIDPRLSPKNGLSQRSPAFVHYSLLPCTCRCPRRTRLLSASTFRIWQKFPRFMVKKLLRVKSSVESWKMVCGQWIPCKKIIFPALCWSNVYRHKSFVVMTFFKK